VLRSSRKPAHDGATLADLPLHRAELIGKVLLRTVVPVAGVLWFGQDVKRLAAIYLVDSWLALTMTLGLLGVHFMTERSAPTDRMQRAQTYASGWLIGAALATFFTAVAGLPLVFFIDDWRALLADRTFVALLASHALACVIAFTREASALPADGTAAPRLRHRFELIFVRWLAVFVVLLFVAPTLAKFWPAAPAFLLVLTYGSFTLFTELWPERVRRALFGRDRPMRRN